MGRRAPRIEPLAPVREVATAGLLEGAPLASSSAGWRGGLPQGFEIAVRAGDHGRFSAVPRNPALAVGIRCSDSRETCAGTRAIAYPVGARKALVRAERNDRTTRWRRSGPLNRSPRTKPKRRRQRLIVSGVGGVECHPTRAVRHPSTGGVDLTFSSFVASALCSQAPSSSGQRPRLRTSGPSCLLLHPDDRAIWIAQQASSCTHLREYEPHVGSFPILGQRIEQLEV